MIQLVAPNLATAGRLGFCLEYADRAFGIGAGEPTAWQAWNATAYKHQDTNLPPDVCVPIWFSYYQNGVNFGHVAINVPGKGIYSSPWQLGTDHAVLPSISSLISIYSNNGAHPMMYVGWSEDISKVQVVKETDMLTPAEVNTLCAIAFNRQAREDEKQAYSGLPIQEVLNRIEGGDESKKLRSDAQAYRDGQANVPAQELKPGLYKVK